MVCCGKAVTSGQIVRYVKALTSDRMICCGEAVTDKQLEGTKQLRTHREFQKYVVMVLLVLLCVCSRVFVCPMIRYWQGCSDIKRGVRTDQKN